MGPISMPLYRVKTALAAPAITSGAKSSDFIVRENNGMYVTENLQQSPGCRRSLSLL
jgi:hypothetical protein